MSFKASVVPLSNSDTVIFEVGATLEGSVHGLVICNSNSTPRPFTLKMFDSSDGITRVILNTTVLPDSQFTWPRPINLEPGDRIIGVGPDLIALHSSFIDSSAPISQGFVGRGEWSEFALYQINDVVSFEGSSYVSNTVHSGSEPPSANWTMLAQRGQDSELLQLIRTPTPVSPVTGGLNIPPNGPLVASPYASIYSTDARDFRRFEVSVPSDPEFTNPIFQIDINDNSTFITPPLDTDTAYVWRCKDLSVSGKESLWMETQTFTTNDLAVVTPQVNVVGGSLITTRVPVITTSAFETVPIQTDTHIATNWEIRTASNNQIVFSSNNNTVDLTELAVPADILQPATGYIFRAQHISSLYGESQFGEINVTTVNSFPNQTFDPVVIGTENINSLFWEDFAIPLDDEAEAIVAIQGSRPSPLTGTNNESELYIQLYNKVSDEYELISSELITDIFQANRANSVNQLATAAIEMITPTLGLVVYVRPITSNVNTFALYGRVFRIVNNSIVVDNELIISDQRSGVLQILPKILRMADNSAVVTWADGTNNTNFQVRGRAIEFLNPAVYILGNSIATLTTSTSDQSGIYYSMTRFNDSRFILYWRITISSSSLTERLVSCSINSSNDILTASTELSIIGGSAVGSVLDPVSLCLLSPTLLLAAGRNSVNNRYVLISINNTLATSFTVLSNVENTSLPNINVLRRGIALVRISDTSALAIAHPQAQVVNINVSNQIIPGPVQPLQPAATNNTSCTVRQISNNGNTVRFLHSIYSSLSLVNSIISVDSGLITSAPIKQMSFFDVESQPSVTFGSSGLYTLSPTRIIRVSNEGTWTGATQSRLTIELYSTVGNTPVFLTKSDHPIVANSTQVSLQPMSNNRCVLLNGNTVLLFSISDSSIQYLHEIALPNANSFLTTPQVGIDNLVRLSDTELLIIYRRVDNRLVFITANISSGEIIFTTANSPVTSNVGTWRGVVATRLSETRILVVSEFGGLTRGTILGLASGNWTVIQTDVPLANNSASSRMQLRPIDSQRAMFMNSHTLSVVSIVNDQILQGGARAIPGSSVSGFSSFEQLDSTRGIVITFTSPNIVWNTYTIGSGTAVPSVFTQAGTFPLPGPIGNITTNAATTAMQPLNQMLPNALEVMVRLRNSPQSFAVPNQNVFLYKIIRGDV